MTDYDFALSRTKILERAFRIVGVIAVGDSMTADQQVQAAEVLNALIKSWQLENVFLWTQKSFTVPIEIGEEQYEVNLNPPFICVDYASLKDSESKEVPLLRYSILEFSKIVDKTRAGTPRLYCVDRENITLWPIPDTDGYTLCGYGIVPLKDWETLSGTGEFESFWLDALVFGVAWKLGYEYHLPLNELANLERLASDAFKKASGGINTDRSDVCYTPGAFR